MITVNTKMIGLLGTPLGQSFSPRMQNEAYATMGLDYHYFPIEVDNTHIEDVINGIRYMNFAGFAVTKPNKEFAVQFMDEMDELAAKMGSINTVVKTGSKLKGYNTDGEGATKSLFDEGVVFNESTFFVWGVGGAGRSVIATLAYKGAKKVYICDITDKCFELANDINERFAPIAEGVKSTDLEKVLELVEKSDVLMNLSGLGMKGYEEETPLDEKYIKPNHICFDATYNPLKTKFLKDAEAKGCKIINGLGMVINQGALQVKLWTGMTEPYEQMTRTINDILKEIK